MGCESAVFHTGGGTYKRLGPFARYCSVRLVNLGPDQRLAATLLSQDGRTEVWLDGGDWYLPGRYDFHHGDELLFSTQIELGTATAERPVWCIQFDVSGQFREGYYCEEYHEVQVLTFGTLRLEPSDVEALKQAYPREAVDRVLEMKTKRGDFRFRLPASVSHYLDDPKAACEAGIGDD